MTIDIPTTVIEGIPSVALWSRASRVTVGTVEITNIGQQQGLDVWFQVRRTLKAGEPNTADLKIYNLSDSSRKAIEQSSQTSPSVTSAPGAPQTFTPVKIEAGYKGNMPTIFLGEMRSAQTVTEGPDFVTELQTGDGDQAAVVARINQSLGPTNAMNVAQALLSAAGIGTGNLSRVASVLRAATLYQQGVTLKGNPVSKLTALCKSVGLEFSVQQGQAQFLSTGQPLDGSAYELSSDTGLVGSPSVDTKGVLSCMTLMLPGLRPGQLIFMNSRFVQGTYRVTSMVTVGDTKGNEWHHKIEAKRPGLAP